MREMALSFNFIWTSCAIIYFLQESMCLVTVVFLNGSPVNETSQIRESIVIEKVLLESNQSQLEVDIHWVYLPLDYRYSTSKLVSDKLNQSSIDLYLIMGSNENLHLQDLARSSNKSIYAYWPTLTDKVDVRSMDIFCHQEFSPTETPIRDYRLFSIDRNNDMLTLAAMVEELSWTSFVIFFDKTREELVRSLLGRLYFTRSKIILYNIKKVDDITHMLYSSYEYLPQGHRSFLVLCSGIHLQKVLHQANIFDEVNEWRTALRQLSKWLILMPSRNSVQINPHDIQLDNVAFIVLPEKPVGEVTDIFRHFLKNDFENIFQNLELNETTSNPFMMSHMLADKFTERFTNCRKAMLYTLLWKLGGRVASALGYINKDFVVSHEHDIFPNTKYGFNNRNFKVATNTWAPFVMKSTINNKVVYDGFCLDLLKELASAMNFRYGIEIYLSVVVNGAIIFNLFIESFTLIEPADGQWGVVTNESWTGLVGQVLRREVDLVVAPLVISSERLNVMDFSFPFFHDYSAVLFKMPDPNRAKWRKLAEPFKWQVFVCIIASFLLLTFLLYTLEKSNPFYVTQNKKRYSFLDMILYVYGAMLIQGGPNQPKSSSGRFLVAFWWLFSIIVAATYSGNLIAFLTVTKDKPPFETLDELGSQNTYRWGTLGGTVWVTFLQSSKGKEIQQLWKGVSEFIKSDPDVLSESTAVHMEKVENGNYAYIADKGMLEIEMATKCDWVFLKELFFPLQYGVGLPKDSPFYKLFYDEMLRIYETGLLQIWKQRWWPKQGTCKGSLISEARKIELVDIQSAFYVIALGIAIASTIILGEIIYTRQKKKSE